MTANPATPFAHVKKFFCRLGDVVAFTMLLAGLATGVRAQDSINEAPVYYEKTKPQDRVAKLAQEIEEETIKLKWDDQHGWLPSVLAALDISTASQTLVFSKTSQQIRKIRPSAPRAIYFNEEVYLGFVRQGDFLEIGAVDPVQGAIFYTLNQTESQRPELKRASSQCLSCHETHKTNDVPGFLVRSVFPKRSGHPAFRLGTVTTDHTTPFDQRFGRWYATGQHGDMRHRGNLMVESEEETNVDLNSGANKTALPERVSSEAYLRPSSDIVALMVLEHQSQFHNHVTKASYTTRQALHYQKQMNQILERDESFLSDSTKRRIKRVADELVEYIFFCDEFPLTAKIRGRDEFRDDFLRNAVKDSQGRSLKEFDLSTRLLKYRCSYLVYSDSFLALPAPVLNHVVEQMKAILSAEKAPEKFAHLEDAERRAILEILSTTHSLFMNNEKKN